MTEFRPSCPGEIPHLRQLWKDCFDDSDGFLDLFFGTAYAPERSIVISQRNRIVGAAYWFVCSLKERTLAYIYAVAISPALQGQGLGSALMEAIHDTLRNQGFDAVLLVPGDDGLRRYYRRFGYRTCSYRAREVSMPPLVPIPSSRYAQLRKALLPPNGVIQEGENLAFLSALADFYQAENAIAALSKEDGSCLELLGLPVTSVPVPYAMGKSLGQWPLPDQLYFAFGFD